MQSNSGELVDLFSHSLTAVQARGEGSNDAQRVAYTFAINPSGDLQLIKTFVPSSSNGAPFGRLVQTFGTGNPRRRALDSNQSSPGTKPVDISNIQGTVANVFVGSNVSVSSVVANAFQASNITASNITVDTFVSNMTTSNISANVVIGSNISSSNITVTRYTGSNISSSNVTADRYVACNLLASNITVQGHVRVYGNTQPAISMTGGAIGGAGSTISLVGAGGPGANVAVHLNPRDNGRSAFPSAQLSAVDNDFSAYLDVSIRPPSSNALNTAPVNICRFANDSVVINGDTSPSSAILTINSTDRGMLVPRMSTVQRQLINQPSEGLQVFDTTRSALCVYTGGVWAVVPLVIQKLCPIASAVTDSQMTVNGVEFRYSANSTKGDLQVRSASTFTLLVSTSANKSGSELDSITLQSNTWVNVDMNRLSSNEVGVADFLRADTGTNWRVRLAIVNSTTVLLRVETF
jgi:hypothetical protein